MLKRVSKKFSNDKKSWYTKGTEEKEKRYYKYKKKNASCGKSFAKHQNFDLRKKKKRIPSKKLKRTYSQAKKYEKQFLKGGIKDWHRNPRTRGFY